MHDTPSTSQATQEQITAMALENIRLLINDGRREEGIAKLRILSKEIVDQPNSIYQIAATLQELSLWDEALEQYRKVSRIVNSHAVFANMVFTRIQKANQILENTPQGHDDH